jgi:uncharacterized repeat protein (TIGR03803 family)
MCDLGWWKKAGAVLVLGCVTATGACAQTYTVLASFDGGDGAGPQVGAVLIQGMDGDLYGTASGGGSGPQGGYGTIFKSTLAGTITALHLFQGTDGRFPTGLLLTTGGNIYGITAAGGKYHDCGTIFQLAANSTFNTLFDFHGGNSACFVYGHLVLGVDGNAYGTSLTGGGNNDGTIFEAIPSEGVPTLHSFDFVDGVSPWAGLTLGMDGNFYGTTPYGGTNEGCYVSGQTTCGTVFKITMGGTFTTLHDFDGTDGSGAYAPLIQGRDGNFYGTSSPSGMPGEYGSIYQMTPSGTVTVLHNFDGDDGAGPFAPLIQATDGNFYGTTEGGGANDYGTIFRITPEGVLTTLYSFCEEGRECLDGGEPLVGLLQSTNGVLYGMTRLGGASNQGVIFNLDIGLSPFVAFVHGFGSARQTFGILGQGFTGTTSVSLNGIPASFTVVSDTFIKATVPAGAMTGYVTVNTPSGVLTSNVPFQVIK